jgi:hypothetical protein
MALPIRPYLHLSGIPAWWIELLGVVGVLAALSILTELMMRYSHETKTIDPTMPISVQHYFRISGIPVGWTELDVVVALKALEPTIVDDDQHPRLFLYPACAGLTQTGLLKLENCLELRERIKSDKIKLEISVAGESAIVDIDCHFYDLTPLNTPGNEIIAEYIAPRLYTRS